MNLIILPGNSPRNKEWAHQAAEAFDDEFDLIYTQEYRHWDMDERIGEIISFPTELQELERHAPLTLPYMIFAKSAGAILTMLAVHKGILHPQRCVFLGVPILLARKDNIGIDDWIKHYSVPTLVIQNSHDPVTDFRTVEHFITGHGKNNFTLKELPGTHHTYNDFKLLRRLSLEFLKG